MKNSGKALLLAAISLLSILLGIALGSVFISPLAILRVLGEKLFSIPSGVEGHIVSIIWVLRVPRVLLAFLVGAALSASGTVMQSVLKNPLASSYTLGISSGSSLAASIIIFSGLSFPLLSYTLLPAAGLIGGMLTVLLVIVFSAKVDRNMGNQTIILAGMVFSLFINALQTILSALSRNGIQRLFLWQMGSFSMRGWPYVAVMAVVTVIVLPVLLRNAKEFDLLTFGEEQALSVGVDTKRKKWGLLWSASMLTGCAVAFTGVIGFVDLIAPHVVRKLFGSSHRWLVPMSALFGGAFLVLADLLARAIMENSELPVGAVTAMIGAPFFAYLYFAGRKKAKNA